MSPTPSRSASHTPTHHAAAGERAVRSAASRAGAKARQAAGDWRSTLARFGLAAKGILYAALGILAIQIAMGEAASQGATKQGAIELVASQPFGQWLLGILTFGLFALALWRAILAVQGDPVEGSETKDRAKFAAIAFLYFGTASTALGVLIANRGAGGAGGGRQEQAAATLMGLPGGVWIVGGLGIALIAFAAYQVYKHGVHARFMERLARGSMEPKALRAVERSGRAGYSARAVVLGIVGIFFGVAAMQHDPDQAIGLSGALKVLATQGWGQALLWLVALGLFLYGLFCFAEARYRRAT